MPSPTRLFRVVEDAELQDLRECEEWRIPVGGAEVKDFWTSRADAERFRQMMSSLVRSPLHLVEVSVPDSFLRELEVIHPDGGTAYAVRDSRMQAFNAAMRIEDWRSEPETP